MPGSLEAQRHCLPSAGVSQAQDLLLPSPESPCYRSAVPGCQEQLTKSFAGFAKGGSEARDRFRELVRERTRPHLSLAHRYPGPVWAQQACVWVPAFRELSGQRRFVVASSSRQGDERRTLIFGLTQAQSKVFQDHRRCSVSSNLLRINRIGSSDLLLTGVEVPVFVANIVFNLSLDKVCAGLVPHRVT